ncbi:3-dehydroquinate synthase [Candidatus Poribacteria bacterium]|nr:3-dehydroquinate synthase [Candidatus Poribacteria bacterium]MYF56780.1 3-dehydroquinate synthase [Candidatus Poribacteria bacterium]
MMKTLEVSLKENSYPLLVGTGLIDRIGFFLNKYTETEKVFIVCDSVVNQHITPIVKQNLVSNGYDVTVLAIPGGEESKSIAQISRVLDALIDSHLDRRSLLIAIGGGVIGDLSGFAASIFMRGIAYVQIPTTLQAQVDASVGGKTAINHPKGKNLIGTFHQPKLVLIDIDTLDTLPERDIKAGLIEVIKMGVIRDTYLFEMVEENLDAILNLDVEILIEMISSACANKADIVAKDEKESHLRMVLNYGHTFGHALESLTEYNRYRHGEAVSIGMNCAAKLAVNLDMLSEKDYHRQRLLLERADLPLNFPSDLSPETICKSMYLDKKTFGGKLHVILPTRIGEVVIRDDVTDEKIIHAISECY